MLKTKLYAGLPDGLFSNQKSIFGLTLVCLALEDVGIFYGHLVHFKAFCYILWTFGMGSSLQFAIFFPFWYVFCTKKNLATLVVCRIPNSPSLYIRVLENSLPNV
jgi:hypothetical protein